jgi:hypothetical protein
MLWIKKIVSENARNVVGVEKSKHFQGENTPAPPSPFPTITYDTTLKLFVANHHPASLDAQNSMVPFCRCPTKISATDEFDKKRTSV